MVNIYVDISFYVRKLLLLVLYAFTVEKCEFVEEFG